MVVVVVVAVVQSAGGDEVCFETGLLWDLVGMSTQVG